MPSDEDPPSPFDPDARPRGILTKKDREFLVSKDDFDAQTKRDKRYRIRNRVIDSYLDFHLLDAFLPDEDRSEIFNSLTKKHGDMTLITALKFMYAGINDIDGNFDIILKTAIEDRLKMENPDIIPRVFVDINIQAEEVTVDDVLNRFVEGEATFKEFNFLMRQPRGLHRLADKLEQTEQDAKMQRSTEEDAEKTTLDAERIREMAEELSPSEDK